MPELDGFDVLQAIGIGHVPVVIFVTAYDQFALRAFEAHALDYLLKPFDDERFEAALQRARERIRQQQGGDLDRRLRALLEEVRGDRGYLQRLVVPTGHRSVFIRTEEIDWIEAERNYIRLHVGGRALPAAGEPEPHRVRAGSGEVLPDPPLHHREHRPHPGRRIALPRRVPGGAPRWNEADLGPQLPEQPARPDGKGELRWGWRFEGHHLSLNFTVVDGAPVAWAPAFFGANPAEVRQGPRAGLRALGEEEDLARELVRSLDPAQRGAAIVAASTPRGIITGTELEIDLLSPAGIPITELRPGQAELLVSLLNQYLGRMEDRIAHARRVRIEESDLSRITFAWAGSTEPGEAHYYRIQGPTFLIEYDNTQNNANHIHSVWRDFGGDFGRDLLREHYREAPHPH
jgi:CheY-like chemotaxis protein